MYSEHLGVGMTDKGSHDVENIFPNLDDAKKNLNFYYLEDVEDNLPFKRGWGDEIPHPVITGKGISLQPSGSTPLDTSGSVLNSGSTPLVT